MAVSSVKLERLAQSYRDDGRDVSYLNFGVIFPDESAARAAYFLDDVHMNDAGQDLVARRLAAEILGRSKPRQSSR